MFTWKCVKHEDQKVLLRDEEIKEIWREYFDRLYNGSSTQNLDEFNNQCESMNCSFMCKIK